MRDLVGSPEARGVTPNTQQRIHSINSWYSSFLARRCVPPKRRPEPNAPCQGYHLRVEQFSAIQLNPGVFYSVRCCFFDAKKLQFFGGPSASQPHTAAPNKCTVQEEFFFHCPAMGNDVQLVMEVIESSSALSSQPPSPSDLEDSLTVGWCAVPVDIARQQYQEGGRVDLEKISLYAGSPLVLLYDPRLVNPPQSVGSIDYIMRTHPGPITAISFFPEFCIIPAREHVPGLAPRSDGSQLIRPVPLQPVPCGLDRITLSFGQHAERLEHFILENINNDRLYRENHAPGMVTGQPMQILERRLRIGVHNGLTFLYEPMIVHLSLPEDTLGTHSLRRKGRPLSRSVTDMGADHDSLHVRTRVSLPRLADDSSLAVVFALDYLIGIRDKDSTVRNSHSFVVCWGAWQPFATQQLSQEVTVAMIGGPRPNPEEALCFKNLLKMFRRDDSAFTQAAPKIALHFDFQLESERPVTRAVSRVDQHVQLTPPRTPQPTKGEGRERTPSRSPERPMSARPRATAEKPTQLPRKKDVESSTEEEENVDLDALPPIGQSNPPSSRRQTTFEEDYDVMQPELDRFIEQTTARTERIDVQEVETIDYRTAAIPRSVYAALAREKFPPITDRNGESPEFVDAGAIQPKLNLAVESNDRLDTNELVIQFLAMKWLSTTANSPNKVFFTFQLYRFPQLTTEKLLLDAPPAFSPAPSILRRLDREEKLIQGDAGFTCCLTVDRRSVPSGEDLPQFLATHKLQIECWDAESLLIVGTAEMPLSFLLRHGRESVQTYAQCHLVQSSLPLAPTTAGLLFVRAACIGHPSSNQFDLCQPSTRAVVSRRLEMLNEEGPHSYRIRAAPLRTSHDSALTKFIHAQRLDIQQRYEQIFQDENISRLEQWKKLRENGTVQANPQHAKFLFDEELQQYQKLRSENKAAKLLQAVFRGITLQHRIAVSYGECEFFEYLLQNPYAEPVNCVVDVDDPALSIITSPDEWSFWRRLHRLDSSVEKAAFTERNGRVEIFLKPMEAVSVPFKYDDLASMGGGGEGEGKARISKTVFKRWDSAEPLSILELTVDSRPYALDRHIRWIEPELTQCAKRISLAQLSGSVRSVRFSNPHVKVQLESVNGGQYLRIAPLLGPSGTSSSVLVVFYADAYNARQLAVWKFSFHSMSRIDVSCTVGQSKTIQLRLNKMDASPVLCALSCPDPAVFFPPEPLYLDGDSVELTVNYTAASTGKHLLPISLVDPSSRQLLGAWLVYARVRQPQIAQTFRIQLDHRERGPQFKKLPIRNPYGTASVFRLVSSNKLVEAPTGVVQIAGYSEVTVPVKFHPVSRPVSLEVILSLQLESTGTQAEGYRLNITYQ